jgi:hypothetical protein
MSERFEMHEVQDWPELKNAGDYMLCDRAADDPARATKGAKIAIIVCPKCLRHGACSDHTMVSERPLTIRASFLCGQHTAGNEQCGWHGWVTDGLMESC